MNKLYCRDKSHVFRAPIYWSSLGTEARVKDSLRIIYKSTSRAMGKDLARTFTLTHLLENPIVIIRKQVEL